MLTRTYIDKINTIIKDSRLNTGINPVSELVYGANVTRMLLHFDHSKLRQMVENKEFCNMDKLHHYLKITNAGSLDFTQLHINETSSIDDASKIRASSFDLIFFLIPKEWDGGKGFDYTTTFFNQGYYGKNCAQTIQDSSRLLSYDGSNWYQAKNGYLWDEEGVYSNETLSNEYNIFSSSNHSDVIIGRQHFDIGNENISVDITDVVNKFIKGEIKNYGIGVAFAPLLESTNSEVENYVGFLTHKTNTFFEPYVETIYDDCILDDRSNFVLDKNNKLYLYCNIGGFNENLDELPTCNVNGENYMVKQHSRGIYYIDINLSSSEISPNTMLYDTWDNIIYKGTRLDAVELEFVTKPKESYFNIGSMIPETTKHDVSTYGINNDETILRGDVRKVVIYPRVRYNRNAAQLISSAYARLYIKDGQREIDVIPYQRVNRSFLENFFVIDTNILIPEKYYMDVKILYNNELIIHHDVLSFKIVQSLDNKYN